MFRFRHQPLKTFYLLYAVTTTLVLRLPYWVLLASIPSFRPRPTWSMKRTILFWLVKSSIKVLYSIGFPAPASDPEVDSKIPQRTGFAWVEAVPPHLIVGEIQELTRANRVAPVRTFGYWYKSGGVSGHDFRPATPRERVLYFLHGGGYVMGSAHPKSMSINIVRGVLETSQGLVSRAFGLEYRLSQSWPYTPANPFPAPLIDALSGYYYLVETMGFEPQNIIVSGDSAGGHLAASLIRYLAISHLPGLSTPGAALLFSPTMDWANTHLGTHFSTMFANDSSDFVREVMMNGYSAASILGTLDQTQLATNAWLSPASLKVSPADGLFAGFPPSLIVAGGAEQTVDGMRTFRDRLVGDNGRDKVVYVEYPDAFHDYVMMLWAEPERSRALEDVGKWLHGIYDVIEVCQ